MVSAPNGVARIPAEQRLNVFALVIYIPGLLGRFLDDLRIQLVPSCNPHAHVSVLPPRPLTVDWQTAREQVREAVESWPSFEITLDSIQVFPVTNVIYLELGSGAERLHELHARMNSAALHFDEPFEYHPHITLAQEISAADVSAVAALSRKLWSDYQGPRSFPAESATFVQNTLDKGWIDLADHAFGSVKV
jgi:2'-5' RNA ligase